MAPPSPRSGIRFLAIGLLVACVAVPGRAEAQTPPRPAPADAAGALLFDLRVPGGLTALFSAIRVAPTARPVALMSLVRVLHTNAASARDSRSLNQAIESQMGVGAAPASASDVVPLPLSPDFWTRTVFKGKVTADGLAYAILKDKSAGLLYHGLMSVDDETLEYFDAHPDLLAGIYEQGVGPFATCARSIHIRNGAVVLPGGPAALPAWEDIVGERAATPDRFVLALIGGDQGRRAYFLDTITHLDAARQAFALAAATTNGRTKSIMSLFEETARFERQTWRFDIWPFVRQPFDPAIVLMEVAALPDGRMKPPSALAFWRAALDGSDEQCARLKPEDGNQPADAAWLVGRLMREPKEKRRALLDSVLFAQRVFASVDNGTVRSACQVVAGFRRFEGLAVTLEALGFSDPGDYLAAYGMVRSLGSTQGGAQDVMLATTQVQGVLAFLTRLASTSAANREVARELARSLWTPPTVRTSGSPGVRESVKRTESLDGLARWMRDVLLRRLCRADESADACLQEAAAGLRPNPPPTPSIDWEGQHYYVEPASASNQRVAQVRQRQRSVSFDSALRLFSAAVALRDGPFPKAIADDQAAFLQALADGFQPSAPTAWGTTVDQVRSVLRRGARQLGSVEARGSTAADLLAASHAVLADAWASFAYAMAIGDIDSSFLLADDPARRHDFGLSRAAPSDLSPAWQLAHEEWHLAGGWSVKGSLLGLERACALSWSRRLSNEPISVRPTLDERDVRGFGKTAAAQNPFDLTDESRAGIVAAIQRGQAAVEFAATDPAAFARRALGTGISEWRVRAVTWAASRQDPAAAADVMSLVDLLWLGNPDVKSTQLDAWGVPTEPYDGSLAIRMPRPRATDDVAGRGEGSLYATTADLNLRLALWLDEMKLPALLMPGILSYATWDLTTSAQPVYTEDYLAVVQAAKKLPAERLVDYLSALTTDATLAPQPNNGRPKLEGRRRP